MRCLYCGKELALLKRLTGSEFCSDTHKQSYQDEYNRLALTRLLQAQSKSDESKSKANRPPVEPKQPEWEPVPEPQAELAPEPQPEPRPAVVEARVQAEPELVSVEMSGFFGDGRPPAREVAFSCKPIAAVPSELTSPPCLPSGPIPVPATEAGAPARAALLPLDLQPPALNSGQPKVALETPAPHADNKEFAAAEVNLNLSIQASSKRGLRPATSIPLTVAAVAGAIPAPQHDERMAEFTLEVEFFETTRAELALTGVEFPPEEAEVVVSEPVDSVDTSEKNGSPRAALQALAKLHKAIQEENTQPDATERERDGQTPWQGEEPAIDTTELERLYGDGPATPAYAARQNQPSVEAGGSTPEAEPVEIAVAVSDVEPAPAEAEAVPVSHARGQLVAMPVKLFTPAKAHLAAGFPAFPHKPEPEIPASDVLPLRPKIAIKPSPAPKAKVEERKASPAPEPPERAAEGAPVPKPAAPTDGPGKNKAPAWTPAPKTTVRPLLAKPATPEPVKAQSPTPAVEEPPLAAPPLKASPSAPKEAPAKASPPEPAPLPVREPDLSVPNLMLTNTGGSFWGSLPTTAKIAMGVVAAILLAIVVYMAASGPKKAGSGASANVAGPSIMMGEGGWVTGWAGDSTGLHRGRQITMYRPSLKLADYRIEFQGRIVNNSMGWVFRASDSGDYYAMKVTQASSGYKLQKSAVVNGRERDAGQVVLQPPPGGLFNIRVDVRGPRFSTYIQGQPVDIWTDNQLKTGGVGFVNDRGDRADIKGVSMSYLAGTGN